MPPKRGAVAAAGGSAKRARPCWADAAAARFADGAGAPEIASAASARPHRDIKGWIVGLLHADHAQRWSRLADDVAAAVGRAPGAAAPDPAAAARAAANAQAAVHYQAQRYAMYCAAAAGGAAFPPGVPVPPLTLMMPAPAPAAAEGAHDPAALVARGIMERVIVRQPLESKRIATSNARRQCAREPGRLTLVRLVDVALELRALRAAASAAAAGGAGTPEVAAAAASRAFARALAALRALRGVNELDDASERVEALVLDPRWWQAHAGGPEGPACAGGPESPALRAVRQVVLAATRHGGGGVGDGGTVVTVPVNVRAKSPICAAAMLADCDKKRAISLADLACGLAGDAVERLGQGEGPLTLKHMRMLRYGCEVRKVKDATMDMKKRMFISLAKLFVPRDWHRQICECKASMEAQLQYAEKHALEDPFNLPANFLYGQLQVMQEEDARARKEGTRRLEDVLERGDVDAPIELARMQQIVEHQMGLLDIARERGSSLACLKLARIHRSASRADAADQMYQVAISRGSSLGALELGIMYDSGLAGARRDPVRAARWYDVARDRGMREHRAVGVEATVRLAALALGDHADTVADHAAAPEYFARARALCVELINYYADRAGVPCLSRAIAVILDVPSGKAPPSPEIVADVLRGGVPDSPTVLPPPSAGSSRIVATSSPSGPSSLSSSSSDSSASSTGSRDGAPRFVVAETYDSRSGGHVAPHGERRDSKRLESWRIVVEFFCRAVLLLARSHSPRGSPMSDAWGPVLHELTTVRGIPERVSGDAHYFLGLLKLSESQEEAFVLFQRAAQLGNPLAPNNAGMYQFSRGDYEDALRNFEKGAWKGDHTAASHAAHVCMEKLNRPVEGMTWLEKAVSLGSPRAPVLLAKKLIADESREDRIARVKSLCELAQGRGFCEEEELQPLRAACAVE